MEPWIRLDRAAPDEARALLTSCCGSTRWVDRMAARRPFNSQAALVAAATDEWRSLDPRDWLEAFSRHPRIGDRDARPARFEATRHLSEREQEGVAGAPDDVLAALADGNRVYEKTFGYTFIVCAAGKSAADMLGLLRARIGNSPDTEILIAAHEQAQITARRLQGLAEIPHR